MDLHSVSKLTSVSDVKAPIPEQSLLSSDFDTVFDGSNAMDFSDKPEPIASGGEDPHDAQSTPPKIETEQSADADVTVDVRSYTGPATPDAQDTLAGETRVWLGPSTEPKRAQPRSDVQPDNMVAPAKLPFAKSGEVPQVMSDDSMADIRAVPAGIGVGDTKAVGPSPSGPEQEKGQRALEAYKMPGKTEQNLAANISRDAVIVNADRSSGRPVPDSLAPKLPPDARAQGLRGLPVDTDNPSTVPEAQKQIAAPSVDNKPPSITQSLSALERHLGGHAVSLASQAASARPDARAATDVLQFNARILTTSGESGTRADLVTQPISPPPIVGPPTASTPVIVTEFAPNPEDQISLQREAIDQIGRDVRVPGTTTIPAAASGAPRADLATSVIQQVADAMRLGVDKPIEIALSPTELGRVRMVLSASDAGITVNILADRADTLDLMRRNIDDLERSFSEMGYEDIAFSFGQTDQETGSSGQRQAGIDTERFDDSGMHDATITTLPTTAHPAIAPDGIDMRL